MKHSSNPKVEPRAYGRNPGAVAQYGEHTGSHVTREGDTGYRGDPDTMKRGYQNPVGPSSMSLSGPGSGRTVMKSGQQNQWGNPAPGNPPAKSTDILRQFGPDTRK